MIIGSRSSARRQVLFNTVRPNSDAASFLLQLASGLTADIAQRSYTLYGSTDPATQTAPGQSRLDSRGEQTLQWARLISELGLTGPQEINHTSLWLRALCNAVSLLNVVQGEQRRWVQIPAEMHLACERSGAISESSQQHSEWEDFVH
eukprot:681274-Amphidinium_carterae.3